MVGRRYGCPGIFPTRFECSFSCSPLVSSVVYTSSPLVSSVVYTSSPLVSSVVFTGCWEVLVQWYTKGRCKINGFWVTRNRLCIPPETKLLKLHSKRVGKMQNHSANAYPLVESQICRDLRPDRAGKVPEHGIGAFQSSPLISSVVLHLPHSFRV